MRMIIIKIYNKLMENLISLLIKQEINNVNFIKNKLIINITKANNIMNHNFNEKQMSDKIIFYQPFRNKK